MHSNLTIVPKYFKKDQEKDINVEPIGPQVDLHEHIWTKVVEKDQVDQKRIKKGG